MQINMRTMRRNPVCLTLLGKSFVKKKKACDNIPETKEKAGCASAHLRYFSK